ncbi:hypothetical protein ACMYSQ_000881 [Aspergillus niger]
MEQRRTGRIDLGAVMDWGGPRVQTLAPAVEILAGDPGMAGVDNGSPSTSCVYRFYWAPSGSRPWLRHCRRALQRSGLSNNGLFRRLNPGCEAPVPFRQLTFGVVPVGGESSYSFVS